MPSQREKLELRAGRFVVAVVAGLLVVRVLAAYGSLWFIPILLAIIGVVVGVLALSARARRIRRQRVSAGLCFHCGYDVRKAEGPLCPECGKPSRRDLEEDGGPSSRHAWVNQVPSVSELMRPAGPMQTERSSPPPKGGSGKDSAGETQDGSADAERRT